MKKSHAGQTPIHVTLNAPKGKTVNPKLRNVPAAKRQVSAGNINILQNGQNYNHKEGDE
jgi:hypothetical protein